MSLKVSFNHFNAIINNSTADKAFKNIKFFWVFGITDKFGITHKAKDIKIAFEKFWGNKEKTLENAVEICFNIASNFKEEEQKFFLDTIQFKKNTSLFLNNTFNLELKHKEFIKDNNPIIHVFDLEQNNCTLDNYFLLKKIGKNYFLKNIQEIEETIYKIKEEIASYKIITDTACCKILADVEKKLLFDKTKKDFIINSENKLLQCYSVLKKLNNS